MNNLSETARERDELKSELEEARSLANARFVNWRDAEARAAELLAGLKTLRLAFRDNAPHIERIFALNEVDKAIVKADGRS